MGIIMSDVLNENPLQHNIGRRSQNHRKKSTHVLSLYPHEARDASLKIKRPKQQTESNPQTSKLSIDKPPDKLTTGRPGGIQPDQDLPEQLLLSLSLQDYLHELAKPRTKTTYKKCRASSQKMHTKTL